MYSALSSGIIAGLSGAKAYYEIITAHMPFLRDNLYYLRRTASQLQAYETKENTYGISCVNILPEEDISADVNYILFDKVEGCGRLRLLQDGARSSPIDIAFCETLPNSLPRVGEGHDHFAALRPQQT